jgi:outer membrane protein
MKNTNYIISGILGVAVIVLYILHFSGKNQQQASETVIPEDSLSMRLPVAYVYEDSLRTSFNYYTSLINDLELKFSKQNTQLGQRYQNLQKEVLEYTQKAQNNAFLTRERMEQEEARLTRKQQELEKSAAQMEQEFGLEQRLVQQQLSDTLTNAMKEFNQLQKYQLIFITSGHSNILHAEEAYNITGEIIDFLNARYKVDK